MQLDKIRALAGHDYMAALLEAKKFYLAEAEAMFGPRDARWKFCGIRFDKDGPRTRFTTSPFEIFIELSDDAKKDLDRALGQLPHEVVHLLPPNPNVPANTFEEGVATWFAHHMVDRYKLKFEDKFEAYLRAKWLTSHVIKADPNAILKLRAKEPAFVNMGVELIHQMVPSISLTIVEALVAPFDRFAKFDPANPYEFL